MPTKLVNVNLGEEITSVMSMFNSQNGIVSHDLEEIEKELKVRTVSYNRFDLETAIVQLIRDKRIVIAFHEETGQQNQVRKLALRTIC